MRLASEERGSITLWMLGLCLLVMTLGGLAVDLWRGLADRRGLQDLADATAFAAASGIDEAHFRSTGEVRLDPARARQLGRRSLAGQAEADVVRGLRIQVSPDGRSVVVVADGTVPLTLLGLLTDDDLAIRVTSTARPVLRP